MCKVDRLSCLGQRMSCFPNACGLDRAGVAVFGSDNVEGFGNTPMRCCVRGRQGCGGLHHVQKLGGTAYVDRVHEVKCSQPRNESVNSGGMPRQCSRRNAAIQWPEPSVAGLRSAVNRRRWALSSGSLGCDLLRLDAIGGGAAVLAGRVHPVSIQAGIVYRLGGHDRTLAEK
jgi:hypothetical protein